MRVEYLRLENVAGLSVGSDLDFIEINFSTAKNKIVSIQAPNGVGKTVLLSSISPFASVTSLDERSTLSYITPGKNGYKEIHYSDGNDLYIIKHYFKASKETHSVKSYISLNGVELNENGNVTSFLSLVEFHLGLTQEMMRLIRLGSNVSSFITLTPARRKEYIGRLIEEIEYYLKIYKKINEDIRVIKVLMSSNSSNLYNCHISDLVVEENRLGKLNKTIKEYERERDQLVAKIGKIQALERENNIDELRRKRQEAEAQLWEFKKTDEAIKTASLEKMTVDQLVKRRNNLTDQKIDAQSKVNSYRISIDNTRRNIERLEAQVKRITSNNDIESLMRAIEELKLSIQGTNPLIKGFVSPGCTSEEVSDLISRLSSYNSISQMIHTFGNRPTEIYLRLRREGKSVERFLKEQQRRLMANVNDEDLRRLLNQVFQDEMIISPACETQFEHCPYYRLSVVINEVRDKLEEENYDGETLRYVQVISNNIDNMLNEIDRFLLIHLPDGMKEVLKEKNILDRLSSKLPFFDLSELQEFISLLREYEVYKTNIEKLMQYEQQLSLYRSSGIDSQIGEIKTLHDNIDFYLKNIETLTRTIEELVLSLDETDGQIGLVTKYQDGKRFKKIVEETLQATNKLLIPLENSTAEKNELTYKLSGMNGQIESLREEAKALENKINEYKRLVREGEVLAGKHRDLNIILESVSTKKGIPVLYMKTYLGKIQKLANSLLRIIYDDELQLAKFKVSQETFEVPYIKNGVKIPDVKYASQAEIAFMTMALSFALVNRASGKYNILLLDEIDAGLDEKNRSSFLKMLDRQMKEIKAEQVFIISHNLNAMINIPMDVIQLADIGGVRSKLQNIIYE